MRNWLFSFALSTLILAPACGSDGPTPASTCAEIDEIACKRTLECNTPEDLMQAGIDSEADCVRLRVNARGGLACTEFTEQTSNCNTGQRYNAEKAASCAEILAQQACSEFLIDPSPGDCELICEAAVR